MNTQTQRTIKNVEIWAFSSSGHWSVLNEYRSENAAVRTKEDFERLRTRAYAALSEWRKVYPDDHIEIVMSTRAEVRRRMRREKIASQRSRHHESSSFSIQHLGAKR